MEIFKPDILLDMLVYGITGAACSIGVFVIIVFGSGNGNLGRNSNDNINGDPGSRLVGEARSATFAAVTWICLFLASEVMNIRMRLFKMQEATDHRYTQVVLGFLSVFPIIHISGLHRTVLKHLGISWQIAHPASPP
ncbi:hypothetical protein JCM11641_003062 [Rhodosporidiobolus odoratus]